MENAKPSLDTPTREQRLELALKKVKEKCDEVGAFDLEGLLLGAGGAFARKFINELIPLIDAALETK